jgi:hypothetical protein
MSILEQFDPSYLFLAGCAVAAWVLMRRRSRMRRGGRRNVEYMEHLRRPTGTWDGANQDVASQIERQQVELCELARDVSGRIDSKMILLEQLIAQSQRQIDRLEGLLAEINHRELAV